MEAKMGFRRTPVTLNFSGLWVVRATLAAGLLFASLAAAQSQQHRAGSGAPDDPVPGSQGSSSVQASAGSETKAISETKKPPSRRGSFIVAPLPISSPALGTGIVPVLGYIFPFQKDDNVSPPSVIGVAGLVTNNGSRAFGTYADLFMKQDTYRITGLYVQGNLNYDLFGIGVVAGKAGHKLPLEQSGHVFRVEALRRLGWDFFLECDSGPEVRKLH